VKTTAFVLAILTIPLVIGGGLMFHAGGWLAELLGIIVMLSAAVPGTAAVVFAILADIRDSGKPRD
jgi:hypothetical protein